MGEGGGIKGRGRLQQAEGQQPGEDEDEERARDGSRRRVRLHRIVQGQVHDADILASTSVDTDAGSLLFIAVRHPASVDDGPGKHSTVAINLWTEDAFWGSDAGARLGPGLAAIIYAMIFL